jgi:hypothetical protein
VESHTIIRAALERVSAKQVSQSLGVSLSTVYKWGEPPEENRGSGMTNPLDRAADLIRALSDPALIKWLCHGSGGFFVHNPRTRGDAPGLVPATNNIIQQFADLLGAISQGAADHRITPQETKVIRRQWDELKTITEHFVRACEDGDYDTLRRELG